MAVDITNKHGDKRGTNPNSLKNLKRFKKGECPNPKGRPIKENSIVSCLKDLLDEIGDDTGKTNSQILAKEIIRRAKAGDSQFLRILMDFLESKPAQKTEITGANGGPLEVLDARQKLADRVNNLLNTVAASAGDPVLN